MEVKALEDSCTSGGDGTKPKITESSSPEYRGPTISYHELTSIEQQHARCDYMVVKDGNFFAHCGKPASTIEHIAYNEDWQEDRPYCPEHARQIQSETRTFSRKRAMMDKE